MLCRPMEEKSQKKLRLRRRIKTIKRDSLRNNHKRELEMDKFWGSPLRGGLGSGGFSICWGERVRTHKIGVTH